MGALRAAFDWLVIVFFVTHIPITILVDSQAIFPAEWYPRFARNMLQQFLKDYKDPLQLPPIAPWFKAFVALEVVGQLPFFFVATYAFVTKKNWIRIPAIIYGSVVCTTMVPILWELAVHKARGYSAPAIIAFYIPYLLVPLAITIFMTVTPEPFGKQPSKIGGNSKRKAKRV